MLSTEVLFVFATTSFSYWCFFFGQYAVFMLGHGHLSPASGFCQCAVLKPKERSRGQQPFESPRDHLVATTLANTALRWHLMEV